MTGRGDKMIVRLIIASDEAAHRVYVDVELPVLPMTPEKIQRYLYPALHSIAHQFADHVQAESENKKL